MNTALRWIIATVGWLALLIVYVVWKELKNILAADSLPGF